MWKLLALEVLLAATAAWSQKAPVPDPSHHYSLAELIDLAEHNNPRTRIMRERAKQSARPFGHCQK